MGIGEREIDVVTAVDGEVVDAALFDGLGGFGFGGLDGIGLGGNGDRLLDAAQSQVWIQGGIFADGQNDGSVLQDGEAGTTVHSHFVLTWRDAREVVAAAVIGDGFAVDARALARKRHFGVSDGATLRVQNCSGKRSGIHLRREKRGTGKHQQTRKYPGTHAQLAKHWFLQ